MLPTRIAIYTGPADDGQMGFVKLTVLSKSQVSRDAYDRHLAALIESPGAQIVDSSPVSVILSPGAGHFAAYYIDGANTIEVCTANLPLGNPERIASNLLVDR